MPDRHRSGPLCFRPADSDREWLILHAGNTGRSVNAILTRALADYRRRVTKRSAAAPPPRRLDNP